MKLLLACVLAVGCGSKQDDPPPPKKVDECTRVLTASAGRLLADMKTQAPQFKTPRGDAVFAQVAPRLTEVLIRHCQLDAWSPDYLACTDKAKIAADFEACDRGLSGEQRNRSAQEISALFQPIEALLPKPANGPAEDEQP